MPPKYNERDPRNNPQQENFNPQGPGLPNMPNIPPGMRQPPDDGSDILGPQIMTQRSIMKSQAQYKGNQHSDLVRVEIIKDNGYYKRGDVDYVHPTLACILNEKGLISGYGEPYERPKFENKDITVDA